MRDRIFTEMVLAAIAACFIAAAWTATSFALGDRWAATGFVVAFWAFVRAIFVL